MRQFADPLRTLREFTYSGKRSKFFSLPALSDAGFPKLDRLPVSLRIVLESVLRHCDGKLATEEDVRRLARWTPTGSRKQEIPFVVSRILLQDFTGVPLLVDLAAMRSAAAKLGHKASIIEPLVPVELVVDHSVQVDYWGRRDALANNMKMELQRNRARYEFLKWGTGAFQGFRVVPPGVGIVHQVNLESLARGVMEADGVTYPDSLVGTDSHTTMINGLGIVGWGVGGIEAEAGMLGQPVYFLTPDVMGVRLEGRLRPGVTATDLVLTVTEALRRVRVVGKFVEYFGEGATSLSIPDRATLANMAPEYGATMGFFPPDEQTCRYLELTGRPAERVEAVREYFRAQGLFGIPRVSDVDYSDVLEIDLDRITPSTAGPKRPQDRIALNEMAERFEAWLAKPRSEGGYELKDERARHRTARVRIDGAPGPEARGGGDQAPETAPGVTDGLTSEKNTNPETEIEMMQNRPTPDTVTPRGSHTFPGGAPVEVELRHGSVVIAAITSCTNTSNPSVMCAAGLVAKKAVERGLRVPPWVKTSLAPGSRVVSDYLTRSGLQSYLDRLGFETVGYGCTTCIGNSGPLDPTLESALQKEDLVAASVLSGNRNFEARVHQSVKANFLMSPPLVVAFALAGRVDIDLDKEPLSSDPKGQPVFLRDLWPKPSELSEVLAKSLDAEAYRRIYQDVSKLNPLWRSVEAPQGLLYRWDPESTYVREPPYFEGFRNTPEPPPPLRGARALAIFGDSITTDHISPAGAIRRSSPAGQYLLEHGVDEKDFNTYGARRGNHEVMVRGTFANVRIRNLMCSDVEGGWTALQPSGERMAIYDAALAYEKRGVPLVIFAGTEYGTGSSRDWAAKGTRLLGVRAVVARSFERIHRSNLVGMGVLPLQFDEGSSAAGLGIDGTEIFSLRGLPEKIEPGGPVTLVIERNGESREVPLRLRIDTPMEVEYYRHGGILPYMLRRLVNEGE